MQTINYDELYDMYCTTGNIPEKYRSKLVVSNIYSCSKGCNIACYKCAFFLRSTQYREEIMDNKARKHLEDDKRLREKEIELRDIERVMMSKLEILNKKEIMLYALEKRLFDRAKFLSEREAELRSKSEKNDGSIDKKKTRCVTFVNLDDDN